MKKSVGIYDVCNEDEAICAKCHQHCGVDYDYCVDNGEDWQSDCCAAEIIDGEGEDWFPMRLIEMLMLK